MLVRQLEILARIAHDTDSDELKQFVNHEIESGSDGIMFHIGLKKELKRILKEGL